MPQIIFIACGSSASWLLRNIIYHKGGLHNRTTMEIPLGPFKLGETKSYLLAKGIRLNDDHLLSLYMAIGGIPYYLDYVQKGKSAQENIQYLFFSERAPLANEYTKLFDSLFEEARPYKALIQEIAKKKDGMSRSELVSAVSDTTMGGLLSERLKKLKDAGFIQEYLPWGKTRGAYYKVIDEFCLFFLHWIHGYRGHLFVQNHWLLQSQRPAYHAWAGYAFEAICAKHIHAVIKALKIETVGSISSWRHVSKSEDLPGAQIDLVIDRMDDAITLCEMKYTDTPFVIDKKEAQNLQRKIETFRETTQTKKQIFLTIVSAHGLKPTSYAASLVDGVVTLEDLVG